MEWKDITIEKGQEFANAKQQQINKEQNEAYCGLSYEIWTI